VRFSSFIYFLSFYLVFQFYFFSNFFIDMHPFHLVLRKRICRENKFKTRNHPIRERENERGEEPAGTYTAGTRCMPICCLLTWIGRLTGPLCSWDQAGSLLSVSVYIYVLLAGYKHYLLCFLCFFHAHRHAMICSSSVPFHFLSPNPPSTWLCSQLLLVAFLRAQEASCMIRQARWSDCVRCVALGPCLFIFSWKIGWFVGPTGLRHLPK